MEKHDEEDVETDYCGYSQCRFRNNQSYKLNLWLVSYYIKHTYAGLDLGVDIAPFVTPLSIIVLFSGWLCFSRRWWWLALISSILGIPTGIMFFVLSESFLSPKIFRFTDSVYSLLGFVVLVIPTILIVISRKEFKKRVIGREVERES